MFALNIVLDSVSARGPAEGTPVFGSDGSGGEMERRGCACYHGDDRGIMGWTGGVAAC